MLQNYGNARGGNEDRAFDLVDIPGKGKGLVAARDIEVRLDDVSRFDLTQAVNCSWENY